MERDHRRCPCTSSVDREWREVAELCFKFLGFLSLAENLECDEDRPQEGLRQLLEQDWEQAFGFGCNLEQSRRCICLCLAMNVAMPTQFIKAIAAMYENPQTSMLAGELIGCDLCHRVVIMQAVLD
ncbi:hypothetical protein NDU88_006883 [Pleurodeles waltl]|uniref:Uncharacterized protein n=1 Tax=Pleurodeles waltl TaxID=8319 RepID=A0AAV7QJ04_PLEWA|nr:hypothetical protein NDU88_006883 [Pleurodeles waltl]